MPREGDPMTPTVEDFRRALASYPGFGAPRAACIVWLMDNDRVVCRALEMAVRACERQGFGHYMSDTPYTPQVAAVVDYIVGAAPDGAAQDNERRKLAERCERLREYVRHHASCVLGTGADQADAPEPCDCGLAELLREEPWDAP